LTGQTLSREQSFEFSRSFPPLNNTDNYRQNLWFNWVQAASNIDDTADAEYGTPRGEAALFSYWVESGFLCQAVFQDFSDTREKNHVGRLALEPLVARDMDL
jgi:hypothetical protein